VTFPIDRLNERSFAADWAGEVFVCDIDRTYLATRFSTLRGLARIPFEFAVDKQDIDGMVTLLREVRRGPGAHSRVTPLYFISASPAQLRPVIQRKMLLDGLEYDGTTFKNWIGVISGLRLRRLREQLGFKITALLEARRDLPCQAAEILLGDDLESDALAFTLYADLLAGRLTEPQLLRTLTQQQVAFDDAQAILELRRGLPVTAGVRRAYIRLERHEAPAAFLDYAPHLVACRGALQIAASLWAQGSIGAAGVLRVAEELARRGWGPETLGERLCDARRRGLLDDDQGRVLCAELGAAKIVPAGLEPPPLDERWREAAARGVEVPRPWTPARFVVP
jgi:hypothetical protein